MMKSNFPLILNMLAKSSNRKQWMSLLLCFWVPVCFFYLYSQMPHTALPNPSPSVIPQFDWLCDVCGCVMSPTLGIYWVKLSFINNCKEPQLWLVLLRYSVDVVSAFPWVINLGGESRNFYKSLRNLNYIQNLIKK